MEGVMMKNQEHMPLPDRKPDGEIVVKLLRNTAVLESIRNQKYTGVLRGVFNFIEALTLGMRTLMFSASFFEEESRERREDCKRRRKRHSGVWRQRGEGQSDITREKET